MTDHISPTQDLTPGTEVDVDFEVELVVAPAFGQALLDQGASTLAFTGTSVELELPGAE